MKGARWKLFNEIATRMLSDKKRPSWIFSCESDIALKFGMFLMRNGGELWKFKKELFNVIQRYSLFSMPGLAIPRNNSKIFFMGDFAGDREKNRKP